VVELCGILLAAGRGKRFGPQGNKLLHAVDDEATPVAVAALRHLLGALNPVYAVVADAEAPLAERLAAAGARVVLNPDAARGMGTSLSRGIAAAGDAHGWVIGLADMPWIQVATIQRVVDALRAGATLVAPGYRGRRGHPVGFASTFRSSLLGLEDDRGARTIIESNASRLQLIEVNDSGILRDIDRPGDLAGAASRQP
jgi:molybdenum cofactor cytidylyltransferase